MQWNLHRLIRPDIEKMESYTPIVPFDVLSARLGYPPHEIVKLDANENPYGPSPKIYQALAEERYYHIYPDPESHALRKGLSAYLNIAKECILAGSGADELIDLILRLCVQPGESIINCPPTFGMYSFLASTCGGQVIRIPRLADFALDLTAIEHALASAQPAKLLFVASPNNPDGRVVTDAELQRLLALPMLIVLDEAYVEFHGESRVAWVEQFPNLIVLRTFSKWAGLGGLRVGYGIFPPAIVEQLWKIKPPYNVNVAGSQAALASLADRDTLMGNVTRLIDERERLYVELERFGFLQPVPDSRANFILCQVLGRDALQLKLALEQQGVLVRHFAKPGLENCIRISAGRPEDTERLLAALGAV